MSINLMLIPSKYNEEAVYDLQKELRRLISKYHRVSLAEAKQLIGRQLIIGDWDKGWYYPCVMHVDLIKINKTTRRWAVIMPTPVPITPLTNEQKFEIDEFEIDELEKTKLALNAVYGRGAFELSGNVLNQTPPKTCAEAVARMTEYDSEKRMAALAEMKKRDPRQPPRFLHPETIAIMEAADAETVLNATPIFLNAMACENDPKSSSFKDPFAPGHFGKNGLKPAEIIFDEYVALTASNEKNDSEKPRLALVPPSLIEAVGKVLTFGADKYTPNGWKKIVHDNPDRYKDAMMRHLCAYLEDENSVDSESGYPHLWHLACCVSFLIADQHANTTNHGIDMDALKRQ